MLQVCFKNASNMLQVWKLDLKQVLPSSMYCNEKVVISQVGEALEEDLSSGGVEGTQLLAHQYIFHLINRSHQLNKQIDTVKYTKGNFNG